MKDFLEKLRNKTDYEKKIIVWSIVIFLGLVLGIAWLYYTYTTINNFNQEEFIKQLNFPE